MTQYPENNKNISNFYYCCCCSIITKWQNETSNISSFSFLKIFLHLSPSEKKVVITFALYLKNFNYN